MKGQPMSETTPPSEVILDPTVDPEDPNADPAGGLDPHTDDADGAALDDAEDDGEATDDDPPGDH